MPNEPVILEHLGDTLVKLGKQKEARETYQKVLDYLDQPEKKNAIEQKIKKLPR